MSIRSYLIALLPLNLLFTLPAPAATTIHVPADQPTIQAGINAAANGDTVLVSPGTYYETINFLGKAITVASANGPVVTIIDAQQAKEVVTFNTGETLSSVLKGFTIQNGAASGIYTDGTSPTITQNILTLNGTCGGTAIAVYSGAPLIQRNLIADNLSPNCYSSEAIFTSDDSGVQIIGNIVSANNGPGVSIYPASGTANILQNTITQNQGSGFFVFGGRGQVTVVQNLIANNLGTGLSWYNPPITAISNTFANNAPSCCGSSGSEINANDVDQTVILQNNLVIATGSAPAFYCGYAAKPPKLSNNDFFSENSVPFGGVCPDPTGTNGNLSSDPDFVDILSNNFHIQSSSPAINAGNPSAPHEPQKDMDGDPRVVGGTIDIGADEYSPNTTVLISPLALHFPSQDVATISAPQTVTLTNQGTAAITLSLIATAANFSQTNNCGATLAAGATCQISVRFSPLSGGTIDGVLGIFTNATTNPAAVSLVGAGLAPQVQINSNFNFYQQVIGTSSTQTGSLTNVGLAPLTINTILSSGATDLTATNNCPIAPNTLAVGASCTFTVTYSPSVVGNDTASITINDDALPNPQTIVLNASSVSAGVPTFSVSTLTFPTTLIGQTSSPQTVKFTNTGTGALGITGFYSSGDFLQTNNCPASLAVNASCTITLTFAPTIQGPDSGDFIIYTDSSPSQAFVAMTGTGQAPVPTLTALSFTTLPVGSANTQITVTGTGFVTTSQILWNGNPVPCCIYLSGNTQITATVPSSVLNIPGTYSLTVFTPGPGGGTSSAIPLVVYEPVNYVSKTTTYSYRTITGTNLNLSYYGQSQITSPFSIQFGGGNFTNLTVGAGGTISFNGFASEYNDVIPTTQNPMLIAPFWAQLYPFGTGADNNVFWAVIGGAPNRQLVVEWRDVTYCCSPDTQDTVKFQVIFSEGTSNILFNYADTVFGGPDSADDNGATASVGVQAAAALGTQFSYDQPSLKSQTALLWYPSSPTATLSANALSFGYHQIGVKSLAQKATLTNGGEVPLLISSIAINNPDFTQTNNCGASLAPHKACTIQTFFTPSIPSAETATLSINDNAAITPQTASLTGIGTITSIVVYPILTNFGTVPVGSSATLPVVLANAANTPLTIQQILPSPGAYTQTNNCGSSVPEGASCTVSVTFTPTQTGSLVGSLSMALNAKKAVNEVTLTGTGR